jgi:hypothetical protein
LRTLKCDLWTEGRLMVSRAGSLYDEAGNLTDDKTRAMLGDYIKSFAASL